MADIIRVFREHIPALRFIGKQYDGFGHWDEWWTHGWFDVIEQAMGGCDAILSLWENGGGYIGLERRAEGEPFAYFIGMLTPAHTPVPDGFVCMDFDEVDLGTCWIRGPESDVHDTGACLPALAAHGMEPWRDASGAVWSFENCLCPRYTTPDETGCVILDYCCFVCWEP